MERYGTEYTSQNENVIKTTLQSKRDNSFPFVCENDGKIWKLRTDAAKFYNLIPLCIGRCLRGTQKTTKGYKFHYLSDNIPEKEIKKRPKRQFICENDGKIWDKQLDAIKFYNLNKDCVSECLLGTKPATKGYKFHYI